MKTAKRITDVWIIALVALVAMAGVVRADFITPTSNAVSSAAVAGVNVINSSGLSVNSAAGTHNNNAGLHWIADGAAFAVVDQWVTFDLGAVYDLTQVYIWQDNESSPWAASRGITNLNIYSGSGADITQIGGSVMLALEAGTGDVAAQTKALSASGVRYIQFNPRGAGSGNANEYCGLAEVRFEGTLTGAELNAEELPLSNAGSGAAPLAGAAANLLSDTFAYDPNFSGFDQPGHHHSSPGFGAGLLSQNSDAENYWYAQVTTGGKSLDYVDVWGNEGANWGRYKGLTLTFYTSTDATTGLLGTSGLFDAEYNGDNFRPTFGRFDVSTVIADAGTRATIQSIKIDHALKTEYLELFEVRAAHSGAEAPDPVGGGTIVKTIVLEVTNSVGVLQWQNSADNSTWNDVAGAMSSELDVTALYTNTPWFRVEASSAGTNAYSTTLQVTSQGIAHGILFIIE
jgi:hypothetical protein